MTDIDEMPFGKHKGKKMQETRMDVEQMMPPRVKRTIGDRCLIQYNRKFNPNLWYGSDGFFNYLEVHYDDVDIMTYSCPVPGYIINARNIITGIHPIKETGKTKVYLVKNNHAKVYFGINDNRLTDTFIGSLNYSPYAICHEIMIKTLEEHGKFLYKEFNSIIKDFNKHKI